MQAIGTPERNDLVVLRDSHSLRGLVALVLLN